MTNQTICVAGLAVLVASTALCGEERTGNNLAQSLDGKWQVIELVIDGRKVPPDQITTRCWFQIEGRDWSYTFPVDGKAATAKFSVSMNLDGTTIAVDAKLRNGQLRNATYKGICKLDGEAMNLCLADKASTPRPKQFESQAGSDVQLFVLRRVESPARHKRNR